VRTQKLREASDKVDFLSFERVISEFEDFITWLLKARL
jgi:hypothetical protein